MALPTAGNAGSNVTNLGSAAAALPVSAPAVGDRAFLVIAHRDTAVGTPAPSDTAGFAPWEQVGSTVSTTNTFLTVWTAVVESTTPTAPTVSDSGDHQQHRLFYVNHVDGTPAIHGTPQSSIDSTSDTSGSMTGYTTTVNDCLILLFASGSGPDANGTAEYGSLTNANLGSLTEIADNSVQTGGGSSKMLAKGTLATAGAIGTTTYTKANASTKAHLVVAVSGPPPPGVVPILAVARTSWP